MPIRPHHPDDHDALVDALVATRSSSNYPWVHDADRRTLSAWLERDPAITRHVAATGAAHGDRAVGHVALVAPGADTSGLAAALAAHHIDPDDTVELTRLFVHPAHSGHGHGQALLAAATHHAHQLGRQPVLWVLHTQRRAHTLYQRNGWKHIATHTNHPAGPLHIHIGPPPSPPPPEPRRAHHLEA